MVLYLVDNGCKWINLPHDFSVWQRLRLSWSFCHRCKKYFVDVNISKKLFLLDFTLFLDVGRISQFNKIRLYKLTFTTYTWFFRCISKNLQRYNRGTYVAVFKLSLTRKTVNIHKRSVRVQYFRTIRLKVTSQKFIFYIQPNLFFKKKLSFF